MGAARSIQASSWSTVHLSLSSFTSCHWVHLQISNSRKFNFRCTYNSRQISLNCFLFWILLLLLLFFGNCDRIWREMAAPNRIERAHQMYREGRYEEALGFYTEAIAMAKTNPQKIALHSNRAACFLKLHDFKKVTSLFRSLLNLLLVLWFGKRSSMFCKVSECSNFSFYFV